jgi:16S rRNA (uracil1498-N3)-methyltransferase
MRFHLPPACWTGEEASLGAAESRHAAAVMRVAPGGRVTVFDGAGRAAEAEVTAVSKRGVRVRLGDPRHEPPPDPHLTLAVAVPKGQLIEEIIAMAVELGVSAVVPLLTRRTVARTAAADRASRQEKWERVAIEACKQCGNNWLPRIHPPELFDDALAALAAGGLDVAVVGSLEPDARPLRDAIRAPVAAAGRRPWRAAALIGPEGDFTAGEYAAARAAGFRPVTLGPRVLRVPTAAVFVLSVLACELRPD